jgi:hypothetical protein
MAMLTREDIYNKMVEETRPVCPHCGEGMVIWECPPVSFSDGLGWGSPYLYVCFNDDCPMYLEGWENIMDHYETMASYRCICDPMSGRMDSMLVYTRDGGKGYIIDEEIRARGEAQKAAERKGLEDLAAFYEAGNGAAVLKVLLAEDTLPVVCVKAAEIMGEIGTLEAIEPVRNHVFQDELAQEKAEAAIEEIHERNFTKECPFCAEIIKARAVVCKHCGRELKGAE